MGCFARRGAPAGIAYAARLSGQEDVTQPLAMQVQVLKRKGPPLAQPLVLPAGWPGWRRCWQQGFCAASSGAVGVASPVAPWLPSRFCCARCVLGCGGQAPGRGGCREPARGWKGVARAWIAWPCPQSVEPRPPAAHTAGVAGAEHSAPVPRLPVGGAGCDLCRARMANRARHEAWWALRFTPRVARVDEALLLEVSTTGEAVGRSRRAAGPTASPLHLRSTRHCARSRIDSRLV